MAVLEWRFLMSEVPLLTERGNVRLCWERSKTEEANGPQLATRHVGVSACSSSLAFLRSLSLALSPSLSLPHSFSIKLSPALSLQPSLSRALSPSVGQLHSRGAGVIRWSTVVQDASRSKSSFISCTDTTSPPTLRSDYRGTSLIRPPPPPPRTTAGPSA